MCRENYAKDYGGLLEIFVKGFKNENPRVRHACIMAFESLLSVAAPTLQQREHKDVMSALIALMNKENLTKLRVETAHCIYVFFD